MFDLNDIKAWIMQKISTDGRDFCQLSGFSLSQDSIKHAQLHFSPRVSMLVGSRTDKFVSSRTVETNNFQGMRF